MNKRRAYPTTRLRLGLVQQLVHRARGARGILHTLQPLAGVPLLVGITPAEQVVLGQVPAQSAVGTRSNEQ